MPEGAALYCPKGLVGRGVSRGTLFPLNPTEGLGTLDVVPRLFVTFCAQKVRMAVVVLPMQFHTGGKEVCITGALARMSPNTFSWIFENLNFNRVPHGRK